MALWTVPSLPQCHCCQIISSFQLDISFSINEFESIIWIFTMKCIHVYFRVQPYTVCSMWNTVFPCLSSTRHSMRWATAELCTTVWGWGCHWERQKGQNCRHQMLHGEYELSTGWCSADTHGIQWDRFDQHSSPFAKKAGISLHRPLYCMIKRNDIPEIWGLLGFCHWRKFSFRSCQHVCAVLL